MYQRLYYNPWGERLSSGGTVLDANPAQPFRHGFTGHEHDDELGLINMKGRLYDARLRRFLTPDPISEVPVRYPLGCLITPCESEEAGPRPADYSVSYTRLGGDESSYQAESASEVRTAPASSGRGARGTDGMAIGPPDLALLTSRGRPAAASEPLEVPVGHTDGLNRYAYALNNPIEYRDPNGYWVETAWDIANVVVGVHSFVQSVRGGDVKGAIIDGAGVVVDVVATVAPLVPAGAAAIIRSSRAADQVADTVKAAKSASTTTKTADGAVGTAQSVVKDANVRSPKTAEQGSYTNTHASGKTYSGKGSRERSQRSGRRVEKETGDTHTATEWSRANDSNSAFKDEARRIEQHGGAKGPENYNRIESPGKKILEKDTTRKDDSASK